MRALSERDDQCQAKLDIMVDAFMRDDWATYRHAAAWLRDFTHQKNIERGRVKSGGNWFMPQKNRGGEEARAHETREGSRSIARSCWRRSCIHFLRFSLSYCLHLLLSIGSLIATGAQTPIYPTPPPDGRFFQVTSK